MRSLSSFLQKEPRELTNVELLHAVNHQPKPWRQRVGASLAVVAFAAAGVFWLQPKNESEASTYPLPRCSFDPDNQRVQSSEYAEWRGTQETPSQDSSRVVGVVACDREVQDRVFVNGRECPAEAPGVITPQAIPDIYVPPTFSAFANCANS